MSSIRKTTRKVKLAFRGVSKLVVMACPEILKQLGKKGTLTLLPFMPNCTSRIRCEVERQ